MNPDQLAALADEHAHLASVIADAKARQEEIKDTLCTQGPGTHTAGDWNITITVPRTFDAKAAENAYPIAEYPQAYSASLDRKKFERIVTPNEYDTFKTEGSPRLSIKPAN